jgi:hypothetical protein
MKRIIILFFTIATVFSSLNAQSYMTAVGLRMGTEWGLTVQQRVAKRLTVEGILQSSLTREEATVTGLLESHLPLITRHLNIYSGLGVHKGWATVDDLERTYEDPFGITLVGGAELSLGRFNVSYDFKPAINLVGGEKRFYTQSAISLRYVLIKDKVFKKMARNKKKRQRQRQRKKGDSNWKFWEKN